MHAEVGQYLTQKEVAKLLGLPEATIRRWIDQGKIPIKILSKKTVLKKSEIINWAKAHNLEIKQDLDPKKSYPENSFSLAAAIEKGGIYTGIQAEDTNTAFEKALNQLSFLINEDRKNILDGLLDREALASTGIGNGIAIPHTRGRLQLNLVSAHVPVIFLKEPIPFNAIDNCPVFVLFMIFTTHIKEHLKILSKLSFILRQETILNIIKDRNKNLDMLDQIKMVENEQG